MPGIINLSEAVFLAVHCCGVLACSNGKRLNGAQLARKINASEHHINKVMQYLQKQGLVSSRRGPSGGYQISFDPSEVSVLDLYEALEGRVGSFLCPFGKKECPFGSCRLGGRMAELSSEFVEFLRSTKIDQFKEEV